MVRIMSFGAWNIISRKSKVTKAQNVRYVSVPNIHIAFNVDVHFIDELGYQKIETLVFHFNQFEKLLSQYTRPCNLKDFVKYWLG